MLTDILMNDHAGSFSKRQQLFLKYTYFVLIDLVVLNLFNQYWDLVFIENFLISLFAAILLQVLLQITIHIEHRVANIFKKRSGVSAKVFRGLSTWAILFISKLVILGAINQLFGDDVSFHGPVHGIVSFIAVVTAMIATEQFFLWIYRLLGNKAIT